MSESWNKISQGGAVFLLPMLDVEDIQAIASSALTGAPQPTALVGFLHALARKTGMVENLVDICIISHSFGLNAGYARHPGEKDATPAPILDDVKGRMTCSMIIRTRGIFEDSMMERLQLLRSAIQGMRLAGGPIWNRNTSVSPSVHMDEASFWESMRPLRGGSVLMDRTDQLLPQNGTEEDALDAMLDLLSTERRDGKWTKNSKGWLVPLLVGWRAISTVQQRESMRGDALGHVWVEEILGMGEWISLRKARTSGFERCMWSHTNPKQGLFMACGSR